MDYERKYKEALEWMQSLYSGLHGATKEEAEKYFPELQENKDDRIVRCLLNYFNHVRYNGLDLKGTDVDEVIAWLEKQGNKSVNIDVESMVSLYEQRLKSQGGTKYSPLANMCLTAFRHGVENVLEELNLKKLEKQGEQMNKPKFKVGDWITDGYVGGQITSIEENYPCYKIVDFMGINTSIPFTIQDNYHLWTIQDAKDGDVLAYVTDEEDLWIMIYWSLYEPYEGHVHYHALLVNNDFSDKGTCCICINNLKPAAKEQRDLLFQKMKDAGYEWDAEKKELKKMEVTSKESEDERIRKGLIEAVSGILKGNKLFGTDVTREEALAWLEKQGKKLNADKVIEWLNDQACLGWIEDVEVDKFVEKFKKDFELC